ncbi:autotransporter outer membrane beta-barrel domain-containing protein [Parasutterella secunda]|uniref:autotransporter outer membrane beta-barrel domain-containing protein n=1 Tax=Parasutterella secunda TaxID=626947 RepID=UPI0025A4A49B|nr:autotransporter outer membrane beta-barrel domain-containing protein [Parasutterella secunda]MDM8226953.1 autotransporter outer membrane beta-barrel domain-containing protein [Parasutterella secunda]
MHNHSISAGKSTYPHNHGISSSFFHKPTILVTALASALSLMASNIAVANEAFKPSNWQSATLTFNLDQIDSETWESNKGALFVLDGDVEGTKIPWWSQEELSNAPGYKNNLYDFSGKEKYAQNEYVEFTLTDNGKIGGFNLGWDYNDEPSDVNSMFAYFRKHSLDDEQGAADKWVKHFIFDGTTDRINLISKNVQVTSINSGDSEAALGLSLTNKRGWMTFNDEAYLISDFSFSDYNLNQNQSGTKGQFIAAGVYTSFGANSGIYDKIFTKDNNGQLTLKLQDGVDLEKYGLTEFNKRTVISVTAKPSENEHNLLNEVFGVFSNEGGSVLLHSGGDIIVKGRDNHHLVSAITAASTLGILDPFKESTINIQAGNDGRVNRIWGWSDSYSQENSVTVTDKIFNENRELDSDVFSNLDTSFEEYLDRATDSGTTTPQTLRSSVIAANGANVTISDENKSGYFDIRGDVISGLKNGEDATSNTVVNINQKNPDQGFSYSAAGTVTRSQVTINLTNSNSTLVGNVYERHRVGNEEAIYLPVDNKSNQSFEAWAQEQFKQEAATLGGTVALKLSNQATWYPTKQWGGWNFDLLYQGFFTKINGKEEINTSYELYDAADQYNLHVWKNNGYTVSNNKYNDGSDVETSKINDLDLLDQPSSTIQTANQKGKGYRTVDNGIYHLDLNGGIVDLTYLREDFQMSTSQTDLGLVNPNKNFVDGSSVKKFRIQALSGTNGTIRMFAQDKYNHDLVIIDEMRDADNHLIPDNNFNLNLVFWNDSLNNNKLTVNPNNPSTYIYVARVPEQVNVTAKGYGQARTTYTVYNVEKDKKTDGVYAEDSWTYEQQQDWHSKNDNWFVTGASRQEADPAVVDTTEFSANIGYLMATTVETLRDRRGEMTLNGTQDDGLWIRYTHNRFGLEGLTLESDGFQMGYEFAQQEENARLFRGIAFDFAQGEVDYSRLSGDSDINRYRLSAYQTYMNDNGFYYDLVGRAGWFDADTQVTYIRDDQSLYDVEGDFNYWAATASFETGWRFENNDGWWIEPETQLQYTYINDYDYGSSQGIKINASDTDSLIGRLGIRAGKVLLSEKKRKMSIWVGSDLLHEWLGDQKGTMSGVDQTIKYDISGTDTWYNAVFGMSWETGSDSRFWVDAKHDFGGDKDDNWTVNAGLTWNF